MGAGWGNPQKGLEAELLVPSGHYRMEQYGKTDCKVLQGRTHFANPYRCGLECLNLKTIFKAMYLIDSQLSLIKGFLL